MDTEKHCNVCGGNHPTGYCTENRAEKIQSGFTKLLERASYLKENPPPALATKKEIAKQHLNDSLPGDKIDFLLSLHSIDSTLVSAEAIEKTIADSPNPDSMVDKYAIKDRILTNIAFKMLQGDYETAASMFAKTVEMLPEEKGMAVALFCVLSTRAEAPTEVKEQYRKLALESGISPSRLESLEQKRKASLQRQRDERVAGVLFNFASKVTGLKKYVSTKLAHDLTLFARVYIPTFDPDMAHPAQDHGKRKGRKLIAETREIAPALFKEGRVREAYEAVDYALSLYPDNVDLLYQKFDLDLLGEDRGRAIDTFQKLKVLITDAGVIKDLERKIAKKFKTGAQTEFWKTRGASTRKSGKYVPAHTLRTLLKDPETYQEGRDLLHRALINDPKNIDLLRIGFMVAVKERDETAAAAFLQELRAHGVNHEMYRSLAGNFERAFPIEVGYRASSVLGTIGSMAPVNRTAGAVTNWVVSEKNVAATPTTSRVRSAKQKPSKEPIEKKVSTPDQPTVEEAVQGVTEIGGEVADFENASQRLIAFFDQERKRTDFGFVHAYKLKKWFLNLGDYIEETPLGTRLSGRYAEKLEEGVNFQDMLEILEEVGVVRSVGEHPDGLLEKVWRVNVPLYNAIKENLAEKIREITYDPADQMRTVDIVARYFGVESEALLASQTGRVDDQKMLRYRQILSYLLHEYTAWSPQKTRVLAKQDIWADKKSQVSRDKRRIEDLLAIGDKETSIHVAHLKRLVFAYG